MLNCQLEIQTKISFWALNQSSEIESAGTFNFGTLTERFVVYKMARNSIFSFSFCRKLNLW